MVCAFKQQPNNSIYNQVLRNNSLIYSFRSIDITDKLHCYKRHSGRQDLHGLSVCVEPNRNKFLVRLSSNFSGNMSEHASQPVNRIKLQLTADRSKLGSTSEYWLLTHSGLCALDEHNSKRLQHQLIRCHTNLHSGLGREIGLRVRLLRASQKPKVHVPNVSTNQNLRRPKTQ